jgi:hypothetical protein
MNGSVDVVRHTHQHPDGQTERANRVTWGVLSLVVSTRHAEWKILAEGGVCSEQHCRWQPIRPHSNSTTEGPKAPTNYQMGRTIDIRQSPTNQGNASWVGNIGWNWEDYSGEYAQEEHSSQYEAGSLRLGCG